MGEIPWKPLRALRGVLRHLCGAGLLGAMGSMEVFCGQRRAKEIGVGGAEAPLEAERMSWTELMTPHVLMDASSISHGLWLMGPLRKPYVLLT